MIHSNKVAGNTATAGSARPDHRRDVIIIGEVDEPSQNNITLNGGTIVHLHLGKPVTDSLAISHEFLRPHKNVLQSLDDLIADGTINRLDLKPVKYADAKGEQRRMIELTETGALIAMPFIDGRNSCAGQVRFVKELMAMRAELAAMLDLVRHGTRGTRWQYGGTNRLTLRPTLINTRNVPDKEGSGLGILNTSKRTDRAMRFFYVCMPSYALYGRRWRGSLRACWFALVCQYSNSVIRRPPRLESGRGVSKYTKEARMPGTTTSKKSPISIVQPLPLRQMQKPSIDRLDAMDMVNTRHQQVQAILESLFMGLDSADPTQKYVKNAIWAAQELLEQAEVAVAQLELCDSESERK